MTRPCKFFFIFLEILFCGLGEGSHNLEGVAWSRHLSNLSSLWIQYFHSTEPISSKLFPLQIARISTAICCYRKRASKPILLHLCRIFPLLNSLVNDFCQITASDKLTPEFTKLFHHVMELIQFYPIIETNAQSDSPMTFP
jgi:hypothetical protein